MAKAEKTGAQWTPHASYDVSPVPSRIRGPLARDLTHLTHGVDGVRLP
jgi:hypothetical protein